MEGRGGRDERGKGGKKKASRGVAGWSGKERAAGRKRSDRGALAAPCGSGPNFCRRLFVLFLSFCSVNVSLLGQAAVSPRYITGPTMQRGRLREAETSEQPAAGRGNC